MRKNFGAKPYLFPQPVMIIGTYDENGKANAMNAAWGGIVGADEIMIDLSSHKTTDNISPITYDTVHYGYYRLGKRVGNAFKDGNVLKDRTNGDSDESIND